MAKLIKFATYKKKMTRGGDDRGNVTLEELTSKLFECKKRGGIIINFKERIGTWYKLGTRGLETTLERIIKRIERLAHEKKWANIDQPESILGWIASNIDQTFDSDHCLISGVLPKYLSNGKMTRAGANIIALAVRGGRNGSGPEPADDDIEDIANGHKNPIRPYDMKLGSFTHDRLTFLVRLRYPTTVGITLMGGIPCYNRVFI